MFDGLSSLVELLIFAILVAIAYYTGIPLDLLITVSVALFIIWFVMHFIRDLYKNPSKKWPASTNPEICLDLNTGALNIISLGDPIEKLSILGPSLHGATGYLYYDAIGIRFWIEPKTQTLIKFQINNEPLNSANTHSFKGRFEINGEFFQMNQMTKDVVLQQLGMPHQEERENEELLKLIYQRNDHQLIFLYQEEELQHIQIISLLS